MFAVIIVIISVLIIVVPKMMGEKSGIARKEYSEGLKKYNISLQSILNGLHIIRTLYTEKYAKDTVNSAVQMVTKKEYKMMNRQLVIYGVTAFLQTMKTVLILWIGVYLISTKQVQVGSLVAVVQLSANIGSPIEVLAYLLHGKNEIRPLLDQYAKKIYISDKDGVNRKMEIHEAEEIVLEEVGCEIGDLMILQNISAEFHLGGKYLIMGASGSGKSTLLKLIAQVGGLEYTGKIKCNNASIKEISLESYYRQVGIVFQEPYLFHATLKENILLGRDISKELYQEIIKKLNLEYLLERYKNREVTPEIIEKLSGGERQRVGLARVMVGQPTVYLLDEVTSALDQANSESIEQLLLGERAMVIHVCHKPNYKLLTQYDNVYKMENGMLHTMEY